MTVGELRGALAKLDSQKSVTVALDGSFVPVVEVAAFDDFEIGIARLERLHLIRVRIAHPERVRERLAFRAPVVEPRARAARPEIDARFLDARLPAIARVVGA